MEVEESIPVQCPYCWQRIEVTMDLSVLPQEFVEDCEVCCRPILFKVSRDASGEPVVETEIDD